VLFPVPGVPVITMTGAVLLDDATGMEGRRKKIMVETVEIRGSTRKILDNLPTF
jgi:hypothetical protein